MTSKHRFMVERSADEKPDGPDDLRRRIVYRHPFWKDEEERERYERAAHLCPVSASGNLTLDQYLAEIAKLAQGIKPQGPDTNPIQAFIRAAAQEAYDLGHKEGVAERYGQIAALVEAGREEERKRCAARIVQCVAWATHTLSMKSRQPSAI